MNWTTNNPFTKKVFLSIFLSSVPILAGTFGFSQPSSAFDFDEAGMTMICKALGMGTGQCSPERFNRGTPTQPNLDSNPSYTTPYPTQTNPNPYPTPSYSPTPYPNPNNFQYPPSNYEGYPETDSYQSQTYPMFLSLSQYQI